MCSAVIVDVHYFYYFHYHSEVAVAVVVVVDQDVADNCARIVNHSICWPLLLWHLVYYKRKEWPCEWVKRRPVSFCWLCY